MIRRTPTYGRGFLAAPQASDILSHCRLARNDDGCLLPVVIDAHLRGTTVTMDISDDPENPDNCRGFLAAPQIAYILSPLARSK
jgi:hypothetical protein